MSTVEKAFQDIEKKVFEGPAGSVYSENTKRDYSKLHQVLDLAFCQAAVGKGKDRHANGRPFDRQPIMELGRMVGVGGPAFQAMKKLQEAVNMAKRGEIDAAKRELLGAINYSAAAYLLLDEQQ